MFKTGSFEQELAESMEQSLVSNQVENKYSFERVAKAADLLHAAAEIFDDTGHHFEAEVLTRLLEKIANKGATKTAASLGDLTPAEIQFFQALPVHTQQLLHSSLKSTAEGYEVDQFIKDLRTLRAMLLDDEGPSTERDPQIEMKSLLHSKPSESGVKPKMVEFESLLHPKSANKKKV